LVAHRSKATDTVNVSRQNFAAELFCDSHRCSVSAVVVVEISLSLLRLSPYTGTFQILKAMVQPAYLFLLELCGCIYSGVVKS